MTPLPAPLGLCRAPATFSPSQLAFGEDCILRAILGSTRGTPSLIAHPIAALGSVFHKLLEKAVRGEIPREGSTEQDATRAMDQLLDAEDARLAAEWPADPPRLRTILPPLMWRRKRRVVLDLAERYLSGAIPRVMRGRDGTRSARELPEQGSWAEVQLDAPSLRLRGRADLIQRHGGHVVIRDLKTGRVLTNEGDVLPHIELQMRLYGMMAQSVWPGARVSLIVDHGVEREVRFTHEDEAKVRVWLEEVLQPVPPDRELNAEAFGTPGRACDGCSFRHVCPAYLRSAPKLWRGESAVRMPLDTWGKLTAVARRSDGLSDLTIDDAAGRTVKVFGVASFRLSEVAPGDRLWLFGLRTRDRRGGPESWRQPWNFFEVSDDDQFARAWTLQLFTER